MKKRIVSAVLALSFTAFAQDGGVTAKRGTLSKAEIRKAINAHKADVRGCYDEGLKANPKLVGKVTAHFEVDDDGNATDAKVEGPAELQSVGDCIAGKISSWKFPKPKGGSVSVSYPFTLKK